MKKKIAAEIVPKDGVSFKLEGNMLLVKGPKGELARDIKNPLLKVELKDNKISIVGLKNKKDEKTALGSLRAHIKNMMDGVTAGHHYTLKICSGHFPMNVSIAGGEFVLKNFLGEKVPRKFKLIAGVDVKIDGDIVKVDGINLDNTSQTAASIEQLTRITNRDRRRFQDGIYIIDKDGHGI